MRGDQTGALIITGTCKLSIYSCTYKRVVYSNVGAVSMSTRPTTYSFYSVCNGNFGPRLFVVVQS